jgi:hypothetical protein
VEGPQERLKHRKRLGCDDAIGAAPLGSAAQAARPVLVRTLALQSSSLYLRLTVGVSPVEEAAMDRLKLETAYLRALDLLMSAVDERQLQAALLSS